MISHLIDLAALHPVLSKEACVHIENSTSGRTSRSRKNMGRIGHGPTKGNRQAPWRARGPLGFSGLGKIPVKPFPGRVWGEIGTTKRFLGTMETIPLLKNPVKPRGGPNPPQNHVFQAPILSPKRGTGPSGIQTWTWGSKNGVQG